jgi:primosomal protein N' (replication factor Y)
MPSDLESCPAPDGAPAPKAARRARASKAAGAPAARRVPVLLPLPFDGPLDYAVPDDLSVVPGSIVEVPLGARLVRGAVWDGAPDPTLEAKRIKPISAVNEVPPLPEVSRRFVDWVAAYTVSPPGLVMRMAMSVSAAFEPGRQRAAWRPTGIEPARMTPGRLAVLDAARALGVATTGELAEEAGVGAGVVRGLADAGALEAVLLPADAPFPVPDLARPGPSLSPAQGAAADALVAAARADRFSATLLEGVTGSGKTEVYSEAIAATLARGRQVLVLLPEIALTSAVFARFTARFGVPPATWHSELSSRERRRVWLGVAEGRAPVVIGARSALFLPFRDLGLIVVDEEHDGAYKQEDGIAYHARDMAVVRANLGRIPVVLVSATPSLETIANAEAGRYAHVHLPERHGAAVLPTVAAIDLRAQPPPRGRWLSPPLLRAMAETLARGEQTLLFLNRRGYAPLTLCRTCGHRFQCPNCAAWLVEHRFHRRLVCHHCAHAVPVPEACPGCGAKDSLAACGPGIERVAEEVAEVLPQARTLVVASDTLPGPAAAAEAFGRIERHEVDLVVGTQIVAKGHHFPLLTLVGVVDADLGLAGGDLRAGERTWQLLSQVAGRAGRADRPGRVLLQTHDPDAPVMRALVANDGAAFLAAEQAARRDDGWPPFGRLAALVVSAPDEARAAAQARALARAAPRRPDVLVLGPAPAPLALLRGQHRHRLLVKAPRTVNLSTLVRDWLAATPQDGAVRIQVDIDPQSFL